MEYFMKYIAFRIIRITTISVYEYDISIPKCKCTKEPVIGVAIFSTFSTSLTAPEGRSCMVFHTEALLITPRLALIVYIQ